ncbi:hypothetical protein DSUL_50138 [Desulfovibrionales bacterium]
MHYANINNFIDTILLLCDSILSMGYNNTTILRRANRSSWSYGLNLKYLPVNNHLLSKNIFLTLISDNRYMTKPVE